MNRSRHPHLPPFEPAEADIQRCAYFLWREEGCPSGCDLDIWFAAKELLRRRKAGLWADRLQQRPGHGVPLRRPTP